MAKAESSTSDRLSWHDNSDNETSFRIERYVNGVYQEVMSVEADATRTVVAGLAPATSYRFRVRAVNAAGMSAPSETASVITRR